MSKGRRGGSYIGGSTVIRPISPAAFDRHMAERQAHWQRKLEREQREHDRRRLEARERTIRDLEKLNSYHGAGVAERVVKDLLDDKKDEQRVDGRCSRCRGWLRGLRQATPDPPWRRFSN
jgi:hypothetical protein